MSSKFYQKSDQPRRFCTRCRVISLCVISLTILVCVIASNRSNYTLPAVVKGQSLKIIYPSQFFTEPMPHHFIGDEHLAPFSTSPPCEDPDHPTYDFLGNDTLIPIHIQKTGGSDFLRHLVTIKKGDRYLCQLPNKVMTRIKKRQKLPKGKQRIACPRNSSDPQSTQWLLAEKTLGWKCGVHPTYTEYKKCVRNLDIGTNSEHSQYRFMAILRHPVLRYLSEYEHVVRGAHWPSKKKCGGRRVGEDEMPPCYPGFYDGLNWTNVTLTEFMSCKSNWANNRQVMWLADLESAGCFDPNFKDRDQILLSSAKCNLDNLTFFGLTEYQNETFFMFEKLFNVTFSSPPVQYDIANLHSSPMLQDIWRRTDLYDKIASINHLDMKLYEHALRLFARRAEAFGMKIDLQEVDREVRSITDVNMSSKKFLKGNFDIPKAKPSESGS